MAKGHGITLTEAEKKELSRCAQAMYGRGRNDLGHLLSGAASTPRGGKVTEEYYDRVMGWYRGWLVFDAPRSEV